MEKRGPVFVTAFSPLMMIIVAIMGSFILAEKIYFGGYIIYILSVSSFVVLVNFLMKMSIRLS